jgi:hypothetical protein
MPAFTPQNDLERLLVQAPTDIGARPAFYRAFLDATLLVICNVPSMQVNNSGRGVVKLEDVQAVVQMQDSQGNLVIPIFSSFQRVEETQAGRVTCVQLKGTELLGLLGTEKPLVLNPMSEYSKEFTPQVLAALQDGSMFQDPEHLTYAPDAKVTQGLPAGYPEALVDALKSLFARYPEITRAYLASIDSADSATLPHPIVGMDLTSNWFDIVRDAGLVAGEILGEGQYVDFLPLRQGDTVSDYMLSTMEPFYTSS